MDTAIKVVGLVLLGLVLACFGILIGAVFFMLAWNYVIPYLFHLPTINYWQAFALLWVTWSILSSAKSTINNKESN
jgi:hypothetical protein